MVMTSMVMTFVVAVVMMMLMMMVILFFCFWCFLCFLLLGLVAFLQLIRALQLALSTHSGAVGVSDGLLHMRLAQDRIRHRQVMCETSTSVIDLEVVLLSLGHAPHIRLFRVLLVQSDVIREFLLQQTVNTE